MITGIVESVGEILHVASDGVVVTPFEGGFTEASKFVVTSGNERFFVKAVGANVPDFERTVLRTEADNYALLGQLGLTGHYFPNYKGFIEKNGLSVLVIGFLQDARWGGPWDETSIRQLHTAIGTVHAAELSSSQTSVLKERRALLAESVEESETAFDETQKEHLFEAAISKEMGGFVSSRGERYFVAKHNVTEQVRVQAAEFDPDSPGKLVLHDLNFGNLAVLQGSVYFVDPVYMAIGNPAFDRTVLGVNILRDPASESSHALAKELFLQDKAALGYLIKYWVACTALQPGEEQMAWMDFQQSCAVTALRVFEEQMA